MFLEFSRPKQTRVLHKVREKVQPGQIHTSYENIVRLLPSRELCFPDFLNRRVEIEEGVGVKLNIHGIMSDPVTVSVASS